MITRARRPMSSALKQVLTQTNAYSGGGHHRETADF